MNNSSGPEFHSQIGIYGEINDDAVKDFLTNFKDTLNSSESLTFELTTLGGDPDAARRIALELDYAISKEDKKIFFLGKTTVYSAGVIILSAFPRHYRYLAKDCVLLIHERRLDKVTKFSGPLRTNLEIAEELVNQFKIGQMIEQRDFHKLAEDSSLTGEDVYLRARDNWYCTAEEAKKIGIVEGLV